MADVGWNGHRRQRDPGADLVDPGQTRARPASTTQSATFFRALPSPRIQSVVLNTPLLISDSTKL
jgi:hypothetical protein